MSATQRQIVNVQDDVVAECVPLSRILTAEVVSFPPAAPLAGVLEAMRRRRISCVVVTDRGQPIGIFTEKDAVRLLAEGLLQLAQPVAEVMSAPLLCAQAEMDYREAYKLMAERGVRHLVVTRANGQLLGVVSEADFLHFLGEEYLVEVKTVASAMQHEVATLGTDARLSDALRAMRDRGTDYVVIVRDGSPVGLLTERDAIAFALRMPAPDTPVGELINATVLDIEPQAPLQQAAQRMEQAGVRRLLVTAGGRLVGVLTRHDIVRGLSGRYLEFLRETIGRLKRELRAAPENIDQSFYRHVIDNTADGFFVLDTERRFVEVNDTLCQLFGYSREFWLGKTPFDFITDESRIELARQIARIDSTERRRYRLVARRRDGSSFPILLNTTTHRDPTGKALGSFGFITDLSVVEEAQQAVIASEKELSRILDHIQETYFRTDAEGRLLRISRAVIDLLGWKPEEVLGSRIADHYWDPAEQDSFLRALAAAGGRLAGYQAAMRHRDGHVVWVSTNAQWVRDAQEAIVGVEGTACDVSEQRRQQEALRLAAQVFENSGEAIMITDAERRILSVNRAYTRTTGYRADEVIGQLQDLLASGHHDEAFLRQMSAILDQTGYWQGEIWSRRKDGEAFPEWLSITAVRDGAGHVTHYLTIFSDISERKAFEARIQFLAQHDPLTHLPNRLLFLDRLEQAIAHAERNQAKVALLLVDLDRFKTVNDSLGHPFGDRLLCDVGLRLKHCVRETDTISRQDGDEFLIVLTDLRDSEAVPRVVEKIMESLATPFQVSGHEVMLTCSIGMAMFPDDGRDFDSLLKKADTAMYSAKEAGRNTFRYFAEKMNVDTMERLELQTRLRRALDRGEFVLHYQPLVELQSGSIVGAEALVRWQCPERGLVPPGCFIPLAEDCGLIVPLGEWVLEEACRELARWHADGDHHLSMAVNLSAIQFRRGNVEESVIRALEKSGASASELELELTESILLHDTEQVLGTVRQLKALGIKLSIDDFGTGYSSLAYLKRFAVDKLKIDQSFVRDLPTDRDDAAIVQAVIQMARSLDLAVLAEGAETEEIASQLLALRCDLVQGYHFGRPMPAADFRRWIAEWRKQDT